MCSKLKSYTIDFKNGTHVVTLYSAKEFGVRYSRKLSLFLSLRLCRCLRTLICRAHGL